MVPSIATGTGLPPTTTTIITTRNITPISSQGLVVTNSANSSCSSLSPASSSASSSSLSSSSSSSLSPSSHVNSKLLFSRLSGQLPKCELGLGVSTAFSGSLSNSSSSASSPTGSFNGGTTTINTHDGLNGFKTNSNPFLGSCLSNRAPITTDLISNQPVSLLQTLDFPIWVGSWSCIRAILFPGCNEPLWSKVSRPHWEMHDVERVALKSSDRNQRSWLWRFFPNQFVIEREAKPRGFLSGHENSCSTDQSLSLSLLPSYSTSLPTFQQVSGSKNKSWSTCTLFYRQWEAGQVWNWNFVVSTTGKHDFTQFMTLLLSPPSLSFSLSLDLLPPLRTFFYLTSLAQFLNMVFFIFCFRLILAGFWSSQMRRKKLWSPKDILSQANYLWPSPRRNHWRKSGGKSRTRFVFLNLPHH